MPVEFVKDPRTGRLVRRGSLSGAGPVVPAATRQRSKPQRKPKEKPWWAQLINAAEYERRQLSSNPLGRLLTLSGARRFANDVRYEARQLSNPQTAVARALTYGMNAINPNAANRGAVTSSVSAATDAARNGIEAYQRLMGAKRGDYANTGLGKFLDSYEESEYKRFGLTPRQEQEGLERFATETASQVVAGAAALATGSALLGAASKAPLIGRAAAGALNLMNPLAGRTAAGKVVRAALAGAYEEGVTTPFVDNTGGSAAGMVNYLLGREAVPDPAAAGADRVDSAMAAVVPNALLGGAMGGAGAALFGGIARGRRAATEASRKASQRKWMEANGIQFVDPESGAAGFTPQVMQNKPDAVPAPANFADAEQQFMEKYGIPGEPQGAAASAPPEGPAPGSPAPGGISFVDPWTNDYRAYAKPYPWPLDQPNPRMDPGSVDPWRFPDLPPEAGFAKAQPGELPEFDPAANPWDIEYDPSLPEASDLGQLIDELDDAELAQVAANSDMPVLQQVQEILQTREQPDINPDRRWDLVSAPREVIADDYLTRYEGRVRSVDYTALRDLVANSSEVAAKVTELTGKTISEFSKADIIDGVLAISDRVLLTNRMTGGQIMPTNDLAVRPDVYQYKADTNADGVQTGKAFGKWDPDAEGIIETRVNSDEGTVDVVNGHHRKSEATRFGIPSMRVIYQQAIDAADARRQGAISNISAGAGTVWDAAKFIKESPDLQDLASLKAAGKTSKGGLWKEGLALSRLPDDLFKAAQDGVIDAKYAVMIGDSGLDPEKMSKLFGVAAKGPSVDEFTARLLIARQAPVGEVSQVDLFGNTQEDLSDELARVFAATKRDLTDDKNTFGRLSRKSTKIQGRTDSKIDVKGSISVSEEAKAALRYFEQSWLTDPEITALMNNGARDLRDGVPAQAVAGQIKQQLPEILQRRMSGDMGGAEAPAAVPEADNPDQGGLFGGEQAAPDAAMDPVEARWAALSPDQQDKRALAARAALLSEKQVANRQPKAEAVRAREAEATAAVAMPPEQFAAQYPDAQAFLEAETQIKAELMADPKNLSRTKKGTPSGLNRAGQKLFDERIKALGEYPGPTMPKNADYKPIKELEAHDDAVRYLEWYDNNVTQRELTPADQDARKAALIARAAQGGEIRPDETPIPDVITDEGIDVNAAAREAEQLLQEGGVDALTDDDLATKAPNLLKAAEEELRLREAQAEQDAEVARAVLEGQREAEGYQNKTYEERREEVTAGFDQVQAAQAPVAPVEIPAKAVIPLVNKRTGQINENALRSAAETLMNWGNAGLPENRWLVKSIDQAVAVIRAKGSRLNLDNVPDIDYDRALNARAMGMTSPETERISNVVRQFYGLEAKGNQGIVSSLSPKANKAPDGRSSIDTGNASTEEQNLRRRFLTNIIQEVAGDDVLIRFNDVYPLVPVGPEWGGKPGQMAEQLGFYRPAPPPDFVGDLIQVNGIAVELEGFGSSHIDNLMGLIETAYHEAFHRIQWIALGEQEAKVLNSAWARFKIALGSGHIADSAKIAYGESMAVAAQHYATARKAALDPVAYMLGSLPQATDSKLWDLALKFFSGVDIVLDFAEKMYNSIAGNGFNSTRSVLEDFYKGNLIAKYDYTAAPLETLDGDGWFQQTWNRKAIEKFDKFTALSSMLREADGGKLKSVSKRALQLAEEGNPDQALKEATGYAQRRLAKMDDEIEAIKQRAIKEGC